MAYGIGSILGDIDQKADAYRNNPDALAQSYQQNQQLIDLLVLQKLKTDKEAAQRDMQAKMQTPASTIKDQREEQVMGMTRNEVAQQVTPGLQALGQQMQAAQAQPQAQGISSVPAPNMQQVGMAGGGIIAFAGDKGSEVKGKRKDVRQAYHRVPIGDRGMDVDARAKRLADEELARGLQNVGNIPSESTYTASRPPPDGVDARTNRLADEELARGLQNVGNIPSEYTYTASRPPPDGVDARVNRLADETLVRGLQDVGNVRGIQRGITNARAARQGQTQDELAQLQTVLGGDSTAGKPTDAVVGHDPYGKPIYESDIARIVYGTEQQTNPATDTPEDVARREAFAALGTNRAALQKPENEDRIYQQSLVSGAGSPDEDMSWWETFLANDRNKRAGNPTLAEMGQTYLANARKRREEKPTVTEVTDSLFSGLEGFMGPEVTERMRTGVNEILPTRARLGDTSGTARDRGAMTREFIGSPFALAGGIGNLMMEKLDPVAEFGKGLFDIQDAEPTETGIGSLVTPPAGTGTGTSTGSTVTPAAQDYVATLNESAPQSTLTPEQINAVLNIPADVINQAPRPVQSAYAGQLDDLENEKRSKLGFWASVLKGFAGKATLAGGLQGASDSMNERRIGIQAEINNLNKEIETIDLKRRELSIAEQANANDLTIAAAQDATRRAEIEADKQAALNTASAKLDADNRLSNANKIEIIKMVNEKWADPNTEELVLAALNAGRKADGKNALRLQDVYKPEYVGPFNATREALINRDVSEMAESIVGGGGASGASGGASTGFTYLGTE